LRWQWLEEKEIERERTVEEIYRVQKPSHGCTFSLRYKKRLVECSEKERLVGCPEKKRRSFGSNYSRLRG
jgi:hypothetical protein